MSRLMALDVGRAKIGVAISDSADIIASPLQVVRYKDLQQAAGQIAKILQKYQVSKVVVGLPVNGEGQPTEESIYIKKIIPELLPYSVPYLFWNEMLTTYEAKSVRGKMDEDAVAAALILQGYLDEVKSV